MRVPDAITIRRATANDAEALWKVRRLAILWGCKDHYSADLIEAWTSNPMPHTFPAFIEAEPFFVAERHAEIVGFAGLKTTEAEVNALFVLPECVGIGLGKQLLTHIEQVAAALQLKTLTLHSSLNAVAFYRAAGYQVGKQSLHTTTGGQQIACVLMEKRVFAK